MRTTVGQLLVNRTLPEDMRDYSRTLDKKTMKKLLSEIAQKYPEEYRQISHELAQIGHEAAYTSGGNSFGLKHMLKAKAAKIMQQKLRSELAQIMADDSLTDDQRDQRIVLAVGKYSAPMQKAVFDESLQEQNPLARQVSSGSRGSPLNLASLRGSDLLYTDHRDRVLPIPVLRSYSEGLSPLEYWAGTYGARKGVIDTKFATQDAGFLSKQLNQIAHRAMVTALDAEKESPTLRGFPVDTSDEDSEGALLAFDVGGYKRNTVLTPKILDDLNRKGVKRILVRSPAVGGPADGGIYARDAGVREFGRLPVSGENVGVTAAQAISEPLSQAQLSSKHAGGVAGAEASAAVSGFDYINQLVQVPRQFKGGAAHSDVDGLVQRIEDGPAGGKYVTIENKQHFIGKDFAPLVTKGDKVEAGDVISEGIPNPAVIVKHKGIGEGRRYFINAFRQAFRDAGITANRRNIELLSRGLINHVRLMDEVGDYAPDDIIPYSQLESSWKPRAGYQTLQPKAAVGRYLERPYLHYSIGDRVRPSMLRDFDEFGIKEVDVHEEEPPFQAEMVRGMSNLQHDPDWVTRMFGSGQKKSILGAVHRGGTSDMTGTSFVPGLAHGVNFGQIGKVQMPESTSTKIGEFSQLAAKALEKKAQEPQEQQQYNISPQAARQLMMQNYYAGRLTDALQRQREIEWYQGGRGSAMQEASDRYNMPFYLLPGNWGRVGTLRMGQGLTDVARGWDQNLGEEDMGPLTINQGGFPLAPERMYDNWINTPFFRQPDVDKMMYWHRDYPGAGGGVPETVSGEEYLLPGEGRWIDEYNNLVRRGKEVPPHIAANATRQLDQVMGQGQWMQQALQDPENAKMFYYQGLIEEDSAGRDRVGKRVFQSYMQRIAQEFPGAFDMLNDASHPSNTFWMLGGTQQRGRLADMYRAYQNYRVGRIDAAEYQETMDRFFNSAAPDDKKITDENRGWDIGEWEEERRQELTDFAGRARRDYQWTTATPEQREQLQQQWYDEDIAESKKLVESGDRAAGVRKWLQAHGLSRDQMQQQQDRAEIDPEKQQAVRAHFNYVLNEMGPGVFSQVDNLFVNNVADAYARGEIDDSQVQYLFENYQPILDQNVASLPGGWLSPEQQAAAEADARREEATQMWSELFYQPTQELLGGQIRGITPYDMHGNRQALIEAYANGQISREQLQQTLQAEVKPAAARMVNLRAQVLQGQVESGEVTPEQYEQWTAGANQWLQQNIGPDYAATTPLPGMDQRWSVDQYYTNNPDQTRPEAPQTGYDMLPFGQMTPEMYAAHNDLYRAQRRYQQMQEQFAEIEGRAADIPPEQLEQYRQQMAAADQEMARRQQAYQQQFQQFQPNRFVQNQPPQQPGQPQQPQQPQPRDAQGRSGFYANLPSAPAPQPRQQQPQQPLTPLAPDARYLARQWQQPNAGPVPGLLQMGMQANPEGMRRMMSSTGPMGVGTFGLMTAPNAMMGLMRGPDSQQNVTLPKIQQPRQPTLPKPPTPKPIEQPKPAKPPGSGETDLVPG